MLRVQYVSFLPYKSVSWLDPSSIQRLPRESSRKQRGLNQKLWFSKKVIAFIAFSFKSEPWGWITQVLTDITVLPPRGLSGATQEGKEWLLLMEATKGDQSPAALQPAALCSLVHSSAITPPLTSAISNMGGGSGLWRQHHTQADSVKLCRMRCWVELIKGWESRGGWAWAQSGARCHSRADEGLWGLEGQWAPQGSCICYLSDEGKQEHL